MSKSPRPLGRLRDVLTQRGPAITASQDVVVNNRRALHVGNKGLVRLAPASAKWRAIMGATHVLINGKQAYRVGDLARCDGAREELASGSPNVLVGDVPADGRRDVVPRVIHVKLVDRAGQPLPRMALVVKFAKGHEVNGITDDNGRLEILNPPNEPYEVFGGSPKIRH